MLRPPLGSMSQAYHSDRQAIHFGDDDARPRMEDLLPRTWHLADSTDVGSSCEVGDLVVDSVCDAESRVRAIERDEVHDFIKVCASARRSHHSQAVLRNRLWSASKTSSCGNQDRLFKVCARFDCQASGNLD